MTNELTIAPEVISSLVLTGDLKCLTNEQKMAYYNYRCQQAGLDPSAKPFDLLVLNGKHVLYANASASQQLCATRKLSLTITAREKIEDLFVVCARVTGADGRVSENTGAVSVAGIRGEALANAMMKATTKATRRTVLAHCGLGMLDESETDAIPGAHRASLDDTPAAALVGFDSHENMLPFYVPGSDEPFSHHDSPEAWVEGYAHMVQRIVTSERFTDATKQDKLALLADANRKVASAFGEKTLTDLKLAVGKAGGSLDPKGDTSPPSPERPANEGASSNT